jgi:methyl-accepting chemotaxis protein
MATKIATALATGTVKEATEKLYLEINNQLSGETPVLVVAFASTSQPLSELMPELRAKYPSSVVLGSSTAGEFTQEKDEKNSVSVFALVGDFKVFAGMAKGLKENVEETVMSLIENLPNSLEDYPNKTAILLLDPLAGNSEEATLLAAACFGGSLRLAGGAAGDDLKMTETFVGFQDRASSDAIVLAVIFSKDPIGVGVCHGHEPISKPLRVTRADQNVVYEIDNEPAWQVWARETSEVATSRGLNPNTLTSSEVGAYLLRYEAGLASGQEYKIRAPLSKSEDGSLSFACGIPENTTIRITESVAERQIESARKAAKRARLQLGSAYPAGALVFDCICRKLILNDDFQKAIKAISDELGEVPLAGFETYGEIALDAADLSGFHNTTTVVLVFPS